MKLSTGGYEIFVCEHREGVKYYLVFFCNPPNPPDDFHQKYFPQRDRESLNSVISFRAPRLPGDKNPLYLKPSLMMVGAREKLALADSSVTKPQRERTANLISRKIPTKVNKQGAQKGTFQINVIVSRTRSKLRYCF